MTRSEACFKGKKDGAQKFSLSFVFSGRNFKTVGLCAIGRKLYLRELC